MVSWDKDGRGLVKMIEFWEFMYKFFFFDMFKSDNSMFDKCFLEDCNTKTPKFGQDASAWGNRGFGT